MSLSGGELNEVLRRAFGFSSFRPNQEAVCRAAIQGRDVLLVMPTGSGKSLCYQLPGIVRGGTTLVISPLIALMEDQVAKLKAQGLAVDRIHSGRQRSDSRQACIDYLSGKLQFLFIAPERLRVSGFPEMLAKRQIGLIAIDEAHCISQWGHDFRPDYRMLGQHLPRFRPAPVIALTATATPIVQDDIAEQLGMRQLDRFVHGFRRDNIAIEVCEIAPSQRSALTGQLLREAQRRPAIVYTPTRKQAESLAAELAGSFPAAAYHAGIDVKRRQQVQEEFQAGRIQVIVATIAFGMGIDKADVRTVIHTALPGSLEAYYQEIGRAGRDGAPSRAILMHSYADRYTHDFFFARDYPDVAVLEAIFRQLRDEPLEKPALLAKLRKLPKLQIDDEIFDKALEKLWTHGGALVDFAENASVGRDQWRDSYIAQGVQKRAQIDLMLRYAGSDQCRMATLVRHFGDVVDGEKACAICDFCAPEDCVAQEFRAATAEENRALQRVLAALRAGGPKSCGKLHTDVCPRLELSRDEFEEVLGAAARAGLLQLSSAVFEKDGRQIPYRRATITEAGCDCDGGTPFELVMRCQPPSADERKKKKKAAGSAVRKLTATAKTAVRRVAQAIGGESKGSESVPDSRVEAALRAWRLNEARRLGVPAFRILTDRTLVALAATRPTTDQEFLAIPGIGAGIAAKYGAKLARVLRESGS